MHMGLPLTPPTYSYKPKSGKNADHQDQRNEVLYTCGIFIQAITLSG